MESDERVRQFNEEHGITWPTVSGLSVDTMNTFGALGAMQVTPTIYILDADGKVLWSDDGDRTQHPDMPSMTDDLEILIELSLLD
jgi:hypothetical protein